MPEREKMFKRFRPILLGAVLVLPLSLRAQDRQQRTPDRQKSEASNAHQTTSNTYYDSKHRDWHQWNNNENQSYQKYSEEHHKKGDFSSANERDQQQYWNWRHKHSDSH